MQKATNQISESCKQKFVAVQYIRSSLNCTRFLKDA
ncbi:hypothetical protein BH10PSE18_BH10PSE18_36710 [soil metagenome]